MVYNKKEYFYQQGSNLILSAPDLLNSTQFDVLSGLLFHYDGMAVGMFLCMIIPYLPIYLRFFINSLVSLPLVIPQYKLFKLLLSFLIPLTNCMLQ